MTPPSETTGATAPDVHRETVQAGIGWAISLIGAVIACLGGLAGRFEMVGLGVSLVLMSHLHLLHRRRVDATRRDRALPAPSTSAVFGHWSWDPTTGLARGDGAFATLSGVATFAGTWSFEELLHRISPADLGRLHVAIEAALERRGLIDLAIDVRNDVGSSNTIRLLGGVEDGTSPALVGVAVAAAASGSTEDLVEDTNTALERSLAEHARTNEELVAIRGRLERKNRELERARAAAVEATRCKGEFLANMSHEIRTPLSSIVGFADLVDEEASEETRRGMLQAIRRNSEHLLSLVNDVLDLSRLEADRVELERIPTSPGEVANDVVGMLEPRATEKGLDLVLEIEDGVPDLVALDPTRLRQVLINLIGNAIKFTEEGGVVARVSYDASACRLEIAVVDSGIGLEPRAIERIFEPFRQADGSTTRRYGGTGLGLHISRRLCEVLGGGLAVTSLPGGGSTFTATFAAPPLQRSESTTPSVDGVPHGLRVLLAEDGPDNRVLVEHLLRKLGADVVSVENGRDAVERLDARPEDFDVLILDMQMPIMDGWEAACRLRNAGAAIPILALTANALPGDRATCLEAGCDGFLTKPVRRDDLASGLMEVLAASRTPQRGFRMAG